jgi:acetyl esterase/lipase
MNYLSGNVMNFNKYIIITLTVIFSVITYQTDAAEKYQINEINDIPYYKNPNPDSNLTKLNLVIPQNLDSMPVFMWVGGSAWAYVDRNREMDLCRKFAEQGILMVSVGHRLSPQLLGQKKNPEGIQHPEHVRDLAKAFKWVYENIEKYGGSKDNIFVGGYSSGAQLSALLASDKKYLEEAGPSKKINQGNYPCCRRLRHPRIPGFARERRPRLSRKPY